MAIPEDYLDQTFGYYTIVKKLGHGAEAEVYLCVDSRTQRGYVLRLAVNDDDIWDNAPKIPPTNRSIEAPNARGSWHAKQVYEPLRVNIENRKITKQIRALWSKVRNTPESDTQ